MATTVEHWSNGRIRWIDVRNEKGELHNLEGPAQQRWYENGQERERVYWVNNKGHNTCGPAHQGWHENGRVAYMFYRVNGGLHNYSGPAHQTWHKSGMVWFSSYYIDGKELTEAEFKARQDSVEVMYADGRKARISKTQAIKLGLIDQTKNNKENLLTTIEYWPNGRIKSIDIKNEEGVLHNLDGPAKQRWYEGGAEEYRIYYVDGKLHNIKRPAIQGWDTNGQTMYMSYWVDNNIAPLTEAEFKALQDSIEVMYADGRTARISKTQAIELGLID